jgi:hypothetical protein
MKRGGTSLREKAGFKGKQANGVGNQLMKRERQVTACTALLPCYYYDVYTSPASAWLSWHPRRFEWTGPFLWKTKSSLCACVITFQTHSTPFWLWRSVTDFWGWGAHRAQLRCPDDVSDDMYEREVTGWALNLNYIGYPDHGRYGDLSLKGKIPTA